MDPQKPIKIVISGKLNYEDDITLNQAAQIIAFIDSSSNTELIIPAASTRLAPVQLTSSISGNSATPRETLDNSGAKTNPEKIVAFASLVLDEGKDTFTLDDVKPLFRRAREATPANLTRDLDTSIRSGWVAEADIKGEYYLTKKAIESLDSKFQKDGATRSASGGKKASSIRKPRRNSTEVPEVFKTLDPIPSSLSGAPNYTAIKSEKDRMIWVIAMSKANGIDGLTNQEIAWVTDHLGVGIPSNNINKAFINARGAGYLNISTQTNKKRVTADGEAFLKGLADKKA